MWNPIIDGALQAQAFETIESIAAAIQKIANLAVADPKRQSWKAKKKSKRGSAVSRVKAVTREQANPSLANGSAGLAILFAYLDRVRCGYRDKETAVYFLDQAMDAASEGPIDSSLYGGVTGIAWAIAHLRGSLFEANNDVTEAVDEPLQEALSRSPWQGDYDLIGGLVGIGVYILEELPSSSAFECLVHLVDRLNELARPTPDGITWFTSPDLLPPWQRELCPNGYYNLGVAHGVPGVIAFLAQAYALDERKVRDVKKVRTKVRPLLEGAVAWLMAQESSSNGDSFFPNWIGPGIAPTSSRVAWCYGELGIAAALLIAGNCLSNANWKREAVRLARRAAARPFDQSGVTDCGLCHGTAGVSHLFNRMFQASHEPRFKNAAREWLERTLDMRHPEVGVAGYAAFRADHWRNEIGILEGAAGIALALLAAVTPIEPSWDRILLMSSPHPHTLGR
jgi:lantibiotic biosynthesis protein